MLAKFGDYDVVLAPAIVNENDDYISVLVTSGDLQGERLVIGSFRQHGTPEGEFGEVQFDAFFDNYSEEKSDEMIAERADFVQLCAMNVLEMAVKNVEGDNERD